LTAFSQIGNGKYRNRNIKDAQPQRRPRSQADQYEAAGFTLIEPPAKWFYTWQGAFPVFRVAPGTINGLAGIVARYQSPDVYLAEWFEYGTDPAKIKERLDDLILDIMRKQADEAIDWAALEEDGIVINF